VSREAEIRRNLIDKDLAEAGWSREKGNLVTEQFLPARRKQVNESTADYSYNLSSDDDSPFLERDRFADYVLLGPDNLPIAVVEAKRDTRDPLEGQEQAAEYAERIFRRSGKRPSIFLSNGEEIYFWEQDRYPPRMVSGFYTAQDLVNLEQLRLYSQPLHLVQPNQAIVEREYQLRAIQTIIDGLKQKNRKFLLVMATGTGKTRTVIALVDLLFRAGWVKRVLFLADRRELVKQADDAFQAYLPLESRTRIQGGVLPGTQRIQLATYPAIMQVLPQLSVGFYDLIIADESHRSIYKYYKEIFTHFDALQIGLTATPTDSIDHNTYELFDRFDHKPTFDYPFDTAVENDHLVDFQVWEAKTRFQIEGIKGNELPYEFQRLIQEQGLDIDEINFEGSDLERKVTNTGTNDLLVDEFMQECRKASDGLPAKSIIFAVGHDHALELLKSFNRRYADQQSRGMAKVIDSRMERAEQMLYDFKQRDMPRVAISVDMLDTGIDVPAIQNLVFAKPVYSQVKFWQMVGRGTRLWTDPVTNQRKNDFLIIDHWENFERFKINYEQKKSNPGEPLPVRLFRLRLHRLALLRTHHDTAMIAQALDQLHAMLKQLPNRNVQVRAISTEWTRLQEDTAWEQEDITPDGRLYRLIAPLMRFLPNVNATTLLFEIHTEDLAIAHIEGNQARVAFLKEQLKDDVARLPQDLSDVREKAHMLAWVESTDFWTHLSLQRILDLQRELAPIMRYRESRPRTIIKLHLPDTMQRRRWITYGPAGEGAFVEDYQEQVEAQVKDLAEQVPTLVKIKQDLPPTAEELTALAALLNKPDLFIREEILQQVYENPDMRLLDFVKHILGVQHVPNRKEHIESSIQDFLLSHPHFSPVQRRFIYALRSVLLRQEEEAHQEPLTFTLAHLSQSPFNRIGNAEDLFNTHDLTELLRFANSQVA